MKKMLLLVVVVFSIMMLASAATTVLAEESPTPDLGPIRNVQIEVEKHWFPRPDSRRDGFPQTDSTGPFRVKADIVSGSDVAVVELYYQIALGIEGDWSKEQMSIDRNRKLSATIRPRRLQTMDDRRLHFYLLAYNDRGEQIWIDEIPGEGHPYNIRIVIPAPFEGVWTGVNNLPWDPRLRIIRINAHNDTEGDSFRYYVQTIGRRTPYSPPAPADDPFAKLYSPTSLMSSTHSYEYDPVTGSLHVTGETIDEIYIRKGR